MFRRLNSNPDLLDASIIWRMLSGEIQRSLSHVCVFDELDSTNAYLLRKIVSGECARQLCLAEMQTSGRGRYGKTWVSPRGANLYMSLGWRLNEAPSAIPRLSLLLGIALADALATLGIKHLGLKWPNDIMWQARKLGGVLIEGADGCIVIGIGLNVRMPQIPAEKIDQPWTDFATILQRDVPSRNWIAARVIEAIIPTLNSFERESTEPLRAAWRRYDVLYGRVVVLESSSGIQHGTALGVDERGRLLLQINGQERAFASGDVRLKREQGIRLSFKSEDATDNDYSA